MPLIDRFDSALSIAAQALAIALFAYLLLAFVLEFIPRKLHPMPTTSNSPLSPSTASPSPTVHNSFPIAQPQTQTQLKQPSNPKTDPTPPNNAQLRQLCSRHKIKWRNANPDRRHLNSAQMFQTLKTLNLL